MQMRILLVTNRDNAAATDASLMLMAYFISQNIDYTMLASQDIPSPYELASDSVASLEKVGITGEYDLIVVLGGDGTILRAARLSALVEAPLLGINFGHLGFLANPNDEGVVALVAAALCGDVSEEQRSNLSIEVCCVGDENLAPEERGPRVFFALNELTITRGSSPRMVSANIEVSGDSVCTLKGDGLIVATPTGSSAYALSAGGPLVSPGNKCMLLVPLATHTLQSRTIVTQGSDVVEISFNPEDGTLPELQLDGTNIELPAPVERVIVRCGDRPTRMLFYKKESFYTRIAHVFF